MNTLCALYKTFERFVNTVIRYDYHDYIGSILWKESEFCASIYFAKIKSI